MSFLKHSFSYKSSSSTNYNGDIKTTSCHSGYASKSTDDEENYYILSNGKYIEAPKETWNMVKDQTDNLASKNAFLEFIEKETTPFEEILLNIE